MKKTLVIFSLIVTFLGLLILSAPTLLKISGLDGPIKKTLAHAVFRDKGAKLSMDNIHIGMGEIHIDTLSIISARQGVQIHIAGFDLHYSLYKLVRIWESPLTAIDGVYLSSPRIIVSDKIRDFRGQGEAPKTLSIKKMFADFPNIQYLGIRDGEIMYEHINRRPVTIGHRLSGEIVQENNGDIQLAIRGDFVRGSMSDFNTSIKFDEKSEDFSGWCQINTLPIDSTSLKTFLPRMPLFKGKLSLSMLFNGNLKNLDETNFNGSADLTDGAVTVGEQTMSNVHFSADIKNNRFSIDNGFAEYKKNPIQFSATMADIFHPRIDAGFSAKNFKLAALPQASARLFNASTVNIDARVKVDTSNIQLDGRFEQKYFQFLGSDFHDLHARVTLDDNVLHLSRFFMGDSSVSISGAGLIDFNTGMSRLNFNGSLKDTLSAFLNKMHLSNQELTVGLEYNAIQHKISGNWRYGINTPGERIFSKGKIKGTPTDITIDTAEPMTTDFNFFAHLAEDDSVMKLKSLHIDDLPIRRLWDDPLLASFFQSHKFHTHLSGELNDLQASFYFEDMQGGVNYLFNGHMRDALSKTIMFDGLIKVDNLEGVYHSRLNREHLSAWFNFQDNITGDVQINWLSDAQISGGLKFTDLNFYKIFTADTIKNDYRKQGTVSGEITLAGNIDRPLLQGELKGNRFVFNNIGYFQPTIKIKANRTQIDLQDIRIDQNNSTILHGNISWFLLNNHVKGELKGSNVDGQMIMSALGTDSLLSGIGDYRFSIYGEADQANIDASIDIKNGSFKGTAFDNLKVNFTDKIHPDKSFFNLDGHKMWLHEMFMAKAGLYHFYAVGKVPLDKNEPLDLVVNFDGDLFRFLPRVEPFFKDGSSISDVALHLTGNLGKIRLSSANIKIDRGDLWLADVASHVQNISGTISIAEGSNKVEIKDLTAFVDKGYLRINTVHQGDVLSEHKLKRWYFRGLDLDFGVLGLETGKQGINIHIPSLMQKNIRGFVQLKGRKADQLFYLSGPVRHPRAFGALTIKNSRITYPFIPPENPTAKPGAAVQFLSAIDWDVALSVGEDVVYERQIPAYIDNVQAELNIDDVSKGLVFSGIIKDGTFKPVGSLESTRGRLEYLDQTFKVDRFKLAFNEFNNIPEISGQAWATIRDSVGAIPKTIYLKLYSFDPATGQERLQGNLHDFRFKLVSADPTIGETQEQVLAYLGYSVDNLKNKATNVGGALTERYLIRPLLRPLERAMEHNLGIDFVRFNSSIARNIFYNTIGGTKRKGEVVPLVNPFSDNFSYLYLMASSEITLGKYLSENLYLTYTGQLVSVYDKVKQSFDFNHSVGLEYRLFNNVLLELEYDRERLGYLGLENQSQYLEDFRVRLRQSFTF